MAIAVKLFSLFLVASFASQASGTRLCQTRDILVNQTKTGKIVEGVPEYRVKVTNACSCSQSRVIVKCFGLNSVEPVDPNLIKAIDEERCVVNNGGDIGARKAIKFNYAWMTPHDFPVVSSKSYCN